jgi:hypothetical protein
MRGHRREDTVHRFLTSAALVMGIAGWTTAAAAVARAGTQYEATSTDVAVSVGATSLDVGVATDSAREDDVYRFGDVQTRLELNGSELYPASIGSVWLNCAAGGPVSGPVCAVVTTYVP